MTAAEHKADFKPAKNTPYLTLSGELLGVFCEYLGENLQHYIGTTL